MNKTGFIISGGDFHELPEEIRGIRPGRIWACDKGWLHAERLGLVPDLAVGDFDSSPPPSHLPCKRVPSRKDDTDTMLAMREALEEGFREIHILCAFGGRLDHSLANLQTGAFAVARNPACRVWLYGRDSTALVTSPGTLVLPRREGRSLSLFALGEAVKQLSLKGTAYEGENLELKADFPLGVSNEWKDSEAVICFKSGILLIIQSKLEKGEYHR
ncbi:MAG: thiamine diphosphokinase [Lachnospiraceae bacterium]|nr:thiamine diphosphokinase [Lachnospiraceae bacterium]